ncbi:glycosyltransferase family 4 protein [Halorarum salinum]|uniref:Glycosyltransferase family 4 protein n=1 Tax=Halorarum salinum TaxID=2743089 RepID=A0A7D5QI70_9EURY|nr:glycosyltransferase family 4 protein [Halobaculum salinum]QLG60425.1 glycosyltransferase family 4 protein [Halobaculum salinum]
MRICLLSDGYPPRDRGGAQKIAAQVAEGYAERGHEVDVITTVTDRGDVGHDVRGGVTVRRLYTPRPNALLPYLTVNNPLVSSACGRALDRADPDVVHAHNVHWLSNASLRAAAVHAPVVKTYHDAGTFAYGEFTAPVEGAPVGGSPLAAAYRASPLRQARDQGVRYFPLRNQLNRRTLERCVDVGVAVSDALGEALRANGMPCRITIHNGVEVPGGSAADGGAVDNGSAVAVSGGPDDSAAGAETEDGPTTDAEADSESGAALRDRHGLGSDPYVLFGGRTGPTKGARQLAAAFAHVRDALDGDPRLLVTGESAYVDRMREIAASHGDRIVSTGWMPRERLQAAIGAATVVATPSVHLDPFPTVNLEAFAAGTPVVTTRFGGADELVADGVDGVVVDPRDVDALADGLASLLADRRRAARYGAAGRRKVRRRFTVDRQVESYLDVLASVT